MPNHNEISEQALRKWFKDFEKKLYEEANIDINDVRDLGRIRRFDVDGFDKANPQAHSYKFAYVCIPHAKGDCYQYDVAPPPKSDMDAYFQWMDQNLAVPTDLEQIRELYMLSQSGHLMVNSPGTGVAGFQQVRTDENGEIFVSRRMDEYEKMESAERNALPEQERLPDTFSYWVEGLAPGAKTFPDGPPRAVKPAPREMGLIARFFSRLGALLGMNTYHAQVEAYEKYEKWLNRLDNDNEDALDHLRNEAAMRKYESEIDHVLETPQGLAYSIFTGVQNQVQEYNDEMVAFAKAEMKHMSERHMGTNQGEIQQHLDSAHNRSNFLKVKESLVGRYFGTAMADLRLYEEEGRSYNSDIDYLPNIQLPNPPEGLSVQEAGIYKTQMYDIGVFAAIAPLTDPAINGDPADPALSSQENAQMNFNKIMEVLIVDPHGPRKPYAKPITDARARGQELLADLAAGKPEELGRQLGQCAKYILKMGAGHTDPYQPQTGGCLSLCGPLLKVLNASAFPELKAHSGLSQEEFAALEGNVAYGKLIQKAMKAKERIQENALYQKNLSPAELREACCDVLLMNVVSASCAKENAAWEAELKNSQRYQDADEKTRQMMLLNERPTPSSIMKLTDPVKMEQARQQIMELPMMQRVESYNREELGRLFFQDSKAMKAFYGSAAPKPEDSSSRQKQMENERENANKFKEQEGAKVNFM